MLASKHHRFNNLHANWIICDLWKASYKKLFEPSGNSKELQTGGGNNCRSAGTARELEMWTEDAEISRYKCN